MSISEQLRHRLIIASSRFANEVADAFAEALGEREAVREEKPRPRRRPSPPPAPKDVTDAELEAGRAALEKRGIFTRKAS